MGSASAKDASPAGAMVVLDVTLYSRLTNDYRLVPLLRLSQLRLQLSTVAPPPQRGTGRASRGDEAGKDEAETTSIRRTLSLRGVWVDPMLPRRCGVSSRAGLGARET
jgi:hypothetical protein